MCYHAGVKVSARRWVTLGAIAYHFEGKLEWDGAKMRFTNKPEANEMLKPKFRKTTNYGHFGRNIPELTWEKTDKVDALKDAVSTLKRM